MAARLRMVRAYPFLFMKGKQARRSSSLMMVRASASISPPQSDQDRLAELAFPYRGLVSMHTCLERVASAVACGVSPDLVSTPSATQPIARGGSIAAHCPWWFDLRRQRRRRKGSLSGSLTPARCSVQMGQADLSTTVTNGLAP